MAIRSVSDHAGVIFDLDGVIIDSEDLQYQAYRQVLQVFGVTITREEYGREWIEKGGGPEYAVRAYRLPVGPERLRDLKNPVYHELLRSRVALMPGVVDALSRLGDAFPLAVATNSSAMDTGFVLDHFDLRDCFTAVITRERYTEPKPAPDAFLTAAAAIDRRPAACVVIEDAFKGVLAASRAGCACVAVPHDFTRDNDFSLATRVVAHLDEVTVAMIEELVK